MYVLGIDISKETVDVALTVDNRHFKMECFPNKPKGHRDLMGWMRNHTKEQVYMCLEATGRYGEAISHFFTEKGYLVSVVNPKQIHAYRGSKLQRNKNDQLDSRLIADFCFTQQPPLWKPPTRIQGESKELSRYINTLKEDRQRKRNQLKAGISGPLLKRSIQKTIRHIDKEIALLEKDLEDLLRSDEKTSEDLDLLLSVPGIGPITARAFLAEVDVSRFAQASHLAAYAGLAPTEHTSGSSVHKKSRMSKIGNKQLRTLFFMPALSAHRFNPLIANLRSRLQAKNKQKMTIVGASMRKLLHLAYGVLKTRKPFDPNHVNLSLIGA